MNFITNKHPVFANEYNSGLFSHFTDYTIPPLPPRPVHGYFGFLLWSTSEKIKGSGHLCKIYKYKIPYIPYIFPFVFGGGIPLWTELAPLTTGGTFLQDGYDDHRTPPPPQSSVIGGAIRRSLCSPHNVTYWPSPLGRASRKTMGSSETISPVTSPLEDARTASGEEER